MRKGENKMKWFAAKKKAIKEAQIDDRFSECTFNKKSELPTWQHGKAYKYQSHKSHKKNVPLIDKCKICGSGLITDLCCKYATSDYNYYCTCGAHFYKDKWYTKKEWDKWIG